MKKVYYNENGETKIIHYLDEEGMPHREDGPAIIEYAYGYDENGRDIPGAIAKTEYYCKNGVLHRLDGPAVIINDLLGKREFWCQNGKYHRTDGPAAIMYKKDGTIIKKKYLCNGEKMDALMQLILETNE